MWAVWSVGRWLRHWALGLAFLVVAAYIPWAVRQVWPLRHGPSPPGEIVSSIPVSGRWVALAFADGPSSPATPGILRDLAVYGAHASFFVVGLNLKRHPGWVRQAAARGNDIETHTEGHINLATHSYSQDVADLEQAKRRIQQLVGTRPHWLLPPYGVWNAAALEAARAAGLTLVVPSAGEGVRQDEQRPSQIVHQVLSHIRPGAVIVLHDGPFGTSVLEALPTLLHLLRVDGYRVGSIPEVWRHRVIKLDESPSTGDNKGGR